MVRNVNVLIFHLFILPSEKQEICGRNEYQCGNKVCISVDYVCDGYNDCFDNSDEMNCQSRSKLKHVMNIISGGRQEGERGPIFLSNINLLTN